MKMRAASKIFLMPMVAFACVACSDKDNSAPQPPVVQQQAYGIATPASAAAFEGVWLIDLQTSGLPGYGNTPPHLTPWGEEQRTHNQKARAAGDVSFDLTVRCSSPGIPRIMTLPQPLQIIARANEVHMIFAWNHVFRQVSVNPEFPFKAEYPTAMGAANGKWQDGKLTVRTTSRNAKTLLDDSIPHSEALEIEEVFSVSADGNTLTNALAITDAKVLAEPWHRTFVYHKRPLAEMHDNDSCLDRIVAGELVVPAGF